MEFYLFAIIGLALSAMFYFGSGQQARRWGFYIFWVPGSLAIILAVILNEYITLFDQDLQSLPYYKISLLAGYSMLIISRIAAIIYGKTTVYSLLAEERQQRAISEITQLAASSSSLIELLNFALDRIVNMLDMAGGAIHIFHKAKQNLVLGSYKGLSARLARRLETLELGDTAIGRTAKNKRLLIIRNLRLSQDYEYFGGKLEGFTHMALIPIISEGEHWGVATLFGKGNYRPGTLHIDLLEQFGEQLGAALVLGRQMRATITSLDNMRALIASLGDELYASSKIGRSGEGAIRGVAWSLTRILGGDRFDIIGKSGSRWRISNSSEPDAIGQFLTRDPDSDIEFDSTPSGIISWDQPPPFKEYIERRPYVFCAFPGEKIWMFIRLESRRRSFVDFEFFYSACKIIHGLSKRLRSETIEKPKKSAAMDQKTLSTEAILDIGDLKGIFSNAFRKISGELGELINEYSKSDAGTDMKSLINWLEVIRKSAVENADLTRSQLAPTEKDAVSGADFKAIVNDAIRSVTSSKRQIPEIDFRPETELPTGGFFQEGIARAINRFLSMALNKAGRNGRLRLTARGKDRSVSLELVGEKLSPVPKSGGKPDWLNDIDAVLEFDREKDSAGSVMDRWRLVIPVEKEENEEPQEKPESFRVLAVDNQDVIRELLSGMLNSLGYEAVVVENSEIAIKEFEDAIISKAKFDLIIADYALDEVTGLELASRLKSIDRSVPFVLISGWGMEPDPVEIEKGTIDQTLKKPFRIEQLAEVIEEVRRETAR